MDTAIQVIWWVGLVVSLGLTVAILKEVAMLIGSLVAIHRLAGITLVAARGVESNMTATSTIGTLGPATRDLAEAVRRLAAAAESIESGLERATGGITKGR
jgi:hypothetical protein